MKLLWSAASPYARKVVACAVARGLDGQLELVGTNPHVSPPELLAINPLSRIPALVLDDGTALFDSPVICEYLDSLGTAAPLFPPAGPARWAALRLQAIADGIMDAAVPRRQEAAKPRDADREAFDLRQKAAIERALGVLEAEVASLSLANIGGIAAAAALGYLDFRFAHEPLRPAHPKLAAWYEAACKTPAIAKTAIPA